MQKICILLHLHSKSGFFVRAIGVWSEDAVLHYQVLAIAQGLRAGYAATHQTQVLRVPTEVFALYFRVLNGAVLRLPKRVLCIENSVMYFDVFCVLEGVLSIQP